MKGYTRSFGGGELSNEFFGQIADPKFQTGLALCRNFRVLPHGPVQNRAGTELVRFVKTPAKRTRILPFTYSTTQTMVLELGDTYIRFHTNGATLLDAGGVNPYELSTPYLEADLFGIHFVQSADVLTLVHPNYPPMELRRTSAIVWTLTTISFVPAISTPLNPLANAHLGTPATTASVAYYVVTAVAANGDESPISAECGCTNNLFDAGAYNTITWDRVPEADHYKVYRKSSGLYGYIGIAPQVGIGFGGTFRDEAIKPNIALTPPIPYPVFGTAGNYPGAVSYYEQRRVFAGTLNEPQTVWGTKAGTESSMAYSLPTQDTDAFTFRVVAREANTIRHLVPLTNLLALTSAAEWRITSVNTDALTQASISVKPQSYIGANNVQPVVVNNNVIYAAARGGHLREQAYNWQAGGYITGDLSLRATHLFDNLDIVDMTYVKAPHPIVWAVSSTGTLLGLTYVPEEQIGAWHQHTTQDGFFESVAAVAEGTEDSLYAVVRRTLNGVQTRTVERFRSRAFSRLADAFFLDCGGTYNGPPVSQVSGLGWLDGCLVAALADGAVVARQTVVGGKITLPTPASTVHVGLTITADLQSLPMALQVDGYGQGARKNVNKVYVRVKDSSGVFSGPSFGALVEFKQRTTENYGEPPALMNREIEIVTKAAWDDSGQVCIRQTDPLPLTIVNLTIDVAVGG